MTTKGHMMSSMLAWVDVETTGTDSTYDNLLELAIVLTDAQLTPVLGAELQRVVSYTPEQRDVMRQNTSDYVRAMHDKTGLWESITSEAALPMQDLDHALTTFVHGYIPDGVSIQLAGNSVRLDLNFVSVNLPSFASLLHYRVVDVSSLQFAMTEWANVDNFPKQFNHAALDDIHESIQQAQYLRDAMKPPF